MSEPFMEGSERDGVAAALMRNESFQGHRKTDAKLLLGMQSIGDQFLLNDSNAPNCRNQDGNPAIMNEGRCLRRKRDK